MTHPAEAALAEHAPRPFGDPYYIPWWAKGEYAARNGTKFALPDGTTIASGRIVTRGSGSASRPAPVHQPQPVVQNARETPRRVYELPPKPTRSPDRAQALWSECNGRTERRALLQRLGLDPAILDDAPNAGVATMRALNAIRKVLK